MKQAFLRMAPLAFAAPLVACAGGSADYPSLAIRDAERVEGTFETEPAIELPVPPAPPSTDLLQRLSQLHAQAASAHGAFHEAAPGARRAVAAARGAGVTSDRWAEAQVALADLDSDRSRAAVALGDLDQLFTEATLAFEPREPIAETRRDVAEMIAGEDAILAELRGAL